MSDVGVWAATVRLSMCCAILIFFSLFCIIIHAVIAGLPEMMTVGDKSDHSVIVHSIVLI